MTAPAPRQQFPPPEPGMPNLEKAKDAYQAAYERWQASGQPKDERELLVKLLDDWIAAAKKGQ